jgi:endonuclease/exonuclease/phosphatase family metal-dependent hydrolase
MSAPQTTNSTETKRPSRWHRPLWWLNVLAAVVFLITFLAPSVSPVISWIPALLAMTFVFQLAVHVGFLVWWFLFRRKRMLLSGALLVLGYGHVKDHVQFFGRSGPEQPTVQEMKVLSYNVRLFDLYNWSHNKVTRDSIFALLHREDADVLCLQEFFQSNDARFFPTRSSLLKDFRYNQAHEHYTHEARYDQHFGIATFSAFPIVKKGFIDFPGTTNNVCIWSDIALTSDTIRVYNAHLASYHFGDEDYKFLQDLDTDTHTDSLKLGGERILKRLRRGFRLRAGEVEKIAEHMRNSPHPVLYCGDMNDVPMSYGYAALRSVLEDAFVESGTGLGGTYIGNLPSLRIDHILHGPELEAWNFRTLPNELSDHRAISSTIGLRAP